MEKLAGHSDPPDGCRTVALWECPGPMPADCGEGVERQIAYTEIRQILRTRRLLILV